MGGLGSGGSSTSLRSPRLTLEQVQATRVGDVLRVLTPAVRHQSERYCGLRLSTTAQPTGGARWWVHCPRCDRRCGVLYQPPRSDIACRRCHRLVYRSQRLSPPRRLSYRASKLYARIGCSRADEYHWRPRGMHMRTFERILTAAEAYDAAAVERSLGRWLSAHGFQ